MKHIEHRFSKDWQRQFIAALKSPNFNFTPNKNTFTYKKLPDPPTPNYKGKITKRSTQEYEVKCRQVLKHNSFVDFLSELKTQGIIK